MNDSNIAQLIPERPQHQTAVRVDTYQIDSCTCTLELCNKDKEKVLIGGLSERATRYSVLARQQNLTQSLGCLFAILHQQRKYKKKYFLIGMPRVHVGT